MIKKVAVIVVLVMVASLSVVGCTQTTKQTDTANSILADIQSSNKQTSNVDGGLEVHATPVTNPPQALGTEFASTPTPGNVYVAFNCTVKNINAKPLSGSQTLVSSLSWYLVDKQGKSYYSLGSVYVEKSELPSFGQRFTDPGDVVTGYVFFDVPKNHTAWNYIYYGSGITHVEIPL
jgi:Domain of unknown function (DUF4352)